MWSKKDILWLKKNYPGLKEKDKTVIEGRLSFQMLHVDGKHIINPSSADVATHANKGKYICDSYNIKIEWLTGESYPQVKEISRKIVGVAEKFGLQIVDVHLYPDSTFCLASWQDLYNSFEKGFNFEIFINEYVVPFLFAQSHFANTKQWPWGQLSHGCWGSLEWLSRRSKYDKKDIILTAASVVRQLKLEGAEKLFSERCRGHNPCPCKSGKKNRDCHPDIKTGISSIRSELSRNLFSLKDLVSKSV